MEFCIHIIYIYIYVYILHMYIYIYYVYVCIYIYVTFWICVLAATTGCHKKKSYCWNKSGYKVDMFKLNTIICKYPVPYRILPIPRCPT